MDEEVLNLYRTFELAATDESDLDELKNRIIDELKEELNSLNINNIYYKTINISKNDDIYSTANSQNDFIQAYMTFEKELDRIFNNNISLDNLDLTNFLVCDENRTKLDLTTSKKIYSLISYLKTFTDSENIYTNINNSNDLLLTKIAFDINIIKEKIRTNIYSLAIQSEEKIKSSILDIINGEYPKCYISESVIDELVSYVQLEIRKLEYMMSKHEKRMSLIKTLLIIGIPTIIFFAVGILLVEEELFYRSSNSDFYWSVWFVFFAEVIISVLIPFIFFLILNKFHIEEERQAIKLFLGLIFSIGLSVILWILMSCNPDYISMIVTVSISSFVLFVAMVILRRGKYSRFNTPAFYYILLSLKIPLVAFVFHEHLGCMITMCALYTIMACCCGGINRKAF